MVFVDQILIKKTSVKYDKENKVISNEYRHKTELTSSECSLEMVNVRVW